ncbi:MAG: MGMT family protein [Candidatus Odinarchaeota archaeon]
MLKGTFSAYTVPTDDDMCVGFIITKINDKLAVYANTSTLSEEKAVKQLQEYMSGIQVQNTGVPEELVDWARKISLILNGIDQDTSNIPLDLQGYTTKQKAVIKAACQLIPVNEYFSYGRVAELAGLPAAHRFVGTTMRICRQPWIIPCQRIKNSQFIRKLKKEKVTPAMRRQEPL